MIKNDRLCKKMGKLLTSHRYDHLPLLPSGTWGIQQGAGRIRLAQCKDSKTTVHTTCLLSYFLLFRYTYEFRTEQERRQHAPADLPDGIQA